MGPGGLHSVVWFRDDCGVSRRKGSRWEPVGKNKMEEGLSTPYSPREEPGGREDPGMGTHSCVCPEAGLGAAW